MPVLVKLSASLRRLVPGYDPLTGMSLSHAPGLDVAGALKQLGVNPAEVKIIMVNGVSAGLDQPLEDGDRLGLFPAVGGG